jgi:hypothetical protein
MLVVGVARNCEKTIEKDVLRLFESLKNSKTLSWFVVESDSSDKTVGALRDLEGKIPRFRFRSLGSLRQAMPLRTQRIAHCRNLYLEELRSNPLYADVDYVVVADLDGVNKLLTEACVASCWTRSEWDVCTANQLGPYYDIWALRHPLWSPNDCFKQYDFFVAHRVRKRAAFRLAVRSRMIVIGPMDDWIEVDSAFGGLAIYRRQVLSGAKYTGLDDTGREICEHVSLNSHLRSSGHRIFINPQLVNANRTDHARQHEMVTRLRRYIARQVGHLLSGGRDAG